MNHIKCNECGCDLNEHSDFECYDTDGTDAVWNDSKKSWVCQDCAMDIPYLQFD